MKSVRFYRIDHANNYEDLLDPSKIIFERAMKFRSLKVGTLIFILCICSFVGAAAPQVENPKPQTQLSKKASKIGIRMSRKAVIKLLGKPTWAIIPEDNQIGWQFELWWDNMPYTPVIVHFDKNHRVTYVEEGLWKNVKPGQRGYIGLGDEYGADQPDRKLYCR